MKISTKLIISGIIGNFSMFIFLVITTILIINQFQASNLNLFKKELIDETSSMIRDSSELFFNLIAIKVNEAESKEETLNYIKKMDAYYKKAVVIDYESDKASLLFTSNNKMQKLIESSAQKIQTEIKVFKQFKKKKFSFDNYISYLDKKEKTPYKVYFQVFPRVQLVVGYGNFQESAFQRNEFFEKKNETRLRSYLYGTVLFIIAGLILMYFAMHFTMKRLLRKPIKMLSDSFQEIVKGQRDLTQKVLVKSSGELGNLANHFNQFMINLNHTMTDIKKLTIRTKNTSQDLFTTSKVSHSALQEIKDQVIEIQDQTTILDKEADITNSAASEVKSFFDSVSNLIVTQSTAINQSSASIEEISSSIHNIAKVTEVKLIVVEALEEKALSGEQEMRATVEVINKVSESANLIGDMIQVINGIAEQTNLLAMNAAIEAAHAGDYGKGFSVVADEIRKLAESTSVHSNEISKSLKEVIQYIHISKETTSKTSSIFGEIVSSIKEVSGSMIEMKNGTEELMTGSDQIIKALASLTKITEDVKNSAKEMTHKIDNIEKSMNKLNIISKNNKDGVDIVIDKLNELFYMIEEVSQIGSVNNEVVIKLENIVGQFKVETERSNGITPKK